MNNNINKEVFDHDISIEEFDHITDGVEDHVFSERYLKRKETIMNNASHKAKISKLGIKIAAAAAAVVVASPFAVNAATGGELFNKLWGNEGKENVDVHEETFVEEGKTRDDGSPVTYDVTMPRIEYVEIDPETAARLIGNNITTEPVVCTAGDTTITVESVVRDGMGIVAAYTVERDAGVNCFNFSQQDCCPVVSCAYFHVLSPILSCMSMNKTSDMLSSFFSCRHNLSCIQTFLYT